MLKDKVTCHQKGNAMCKSLPVTIVLTILLLVSATVGAPTKINYQARLTTAGGSDFPADSFFDIAFRLYADSTGSDVLWTEEHGVTLSDGLFSVILGSSTPLDFSLFPVPPDSLYLEIQVDSDVPLSPRTRFRSVPMAAVAASLQGDVTIDESVMTMLDSLGDTTIIWDANARGGVITDLHPPGGGGKGHQISPGIDDSSSFVEMVAFNDVDSSHTSIAAIESRSVLKTYFETGDVPTQAQFGSFIEGSFVRLTYDTTADLLLGTTDTGSVLRMSEDQENADGSSSRYEFTVLPDRMEFIRGIREGGRTVGAGQVTSLGLSRFLMLDSLDDGTVSKILDRGEAGDNVGRRAARTGRNPQTGATIQMSAETILSDTSGSSFSLRRLDEDSDNDGVLDLLVDEDGVSLRMNKGELVDALCCQIASAAIVVDTTKAQLTLSKADAGKALNAFVSSTSMGLVFIDSTLNDSGLIDLRTDLDGDNGCNIRTGKKVAKFKAGAALAGAVNKSAMPDDGSPEGAYLGLAGELDHFVEITVDSVSSSLVFADTLGDTTIVLSNPAGGSGELHVIANNTGTGMAPSKVAIADLDADGLMDVRVDGRIGIGVSMPSSILQVKQSSATDPIADAWTTYSSRRWKENIRTINGAIDKVQQLRGVEYDWKANGKHDIGLIAEEVGEVIPEVVVFEQNGIDAKSVDYSRLVALLIEASKEQQSTIETMQNEIAQLKTLVTKIANKSSAKDNTNYGMK